jgi:hypothetical protein
MQQDAAYLQWEALNREKWAGEEAEAEAKLRALREKYGKPGAPMAWIKPVSCFSARDTRAGTICSTTRAPS